MILCPFLLDVNESNAYVLACEDTHDAILVDAGALDDRIVTFIEDHHLRLSSIFITHDHYDHTAGLAGFTERFPDAALLNGPGSKGGGGTEVRVGKLLGAVLATPGHTPDSMSLTFPGLVFTGDALFSGSVGGTSSQANAQMQLDYLRRNVLSLPEHYEVHPGHGPASTIGIEKHHNPFLAGSNQAGG